MTLLEAQKQQSELCILMEGSEGRFVVRQEIEEWIGSYRLRWMLRNARTMQVVQSEQHLEDILRSAATFAGR